MRTSRHRAFLRWNGGELLHVGFRRPGWTNGLSGLSWRCGGRGDVLRLCALGLGGLHGLGLARRNGRLVALVPAAPLRLLARQQVGVRRRPEGSAAREEALERRLLPPGRIAARAWLRSPARTSILPFSSLAVTAVRNWPPVLCATQARGLSVCFAFSSNPITWMRNPGEACSATSPWRRHWPCSCRGRR